MFLRGRDTQIIGGRQKGWRNKLKEVTVLLHFELLEQSVQSLIAILKIKMYEDEKKWHKGGYGRTWHSKIRTWKLVMSVLN